ncbi:MAG: hypothetical protein AB7E39_07970 [Endomicrobiaceae bacterium]
MKNDFKLFQLIYVSLIIALIFLMFFELLLFLFYPKHYNRLSDILRIIEQDSVLIWKQKPNLDTEFQNKNLKTNSLGFRNKEITPKKNIRIVSLGASPTFGWGVKYEDTYPYVIEKELRNQNIEVESINAGEIGYSSYQGLKLLDKTVLSLNPDIITVSYVINDIDKYRFFRSCLKRDSMLKPLSNFTVSIYNVINQTNLIRLINDISVKLKSNRAKYYGNCNIYNENRRVSIDEYENNLNLFADIAQKNNIKIVFIVMPVNLPVKRALKDPEKKYMLVSLEEAENEIQNKNYKRAKRILDRLLCIDKYSPKVYYYLGIIADMEHNSKLSNDMFEKAKNYEIFDCASVSLKYNDVMRKVAAERQISLCDSAKDFKEYKDGYLFVDPELDSFHPNAAGHELIAKRLAEILINNYFGNFSNSGSK